MKVMVVGGEDVRKFNIAAYMPKNAEMLITGGGKGVEAIAEAYADQQGLSKLILRSHKGGEDAQRQSMKMVELADEIIVVRSEKNRECVYAIDYAYKSGKPLTILTVD